MPTEAEFLNFVRQQEMQRAQQRAMSPANTQMAQQPYDQSRMQEMLNTPMGGHPADFEYRRMMEQMAPPRGMLGTPPPPSTSKPDDWVEYKHRMERMAQPPVDYGTRALAPGPFIGAP